MKKYLLSLLNFVFACRCLSQDINSIPFSVALISDGGSITAIGYPHDEKPREIVSIATANFGFANDSIILLAPKVTGKTLDLTKYDVIAISLQKPGASILGKIVLPPNFRPSEYMGPPENGLVYDAPSKKLYFAAKEFREKTATSCLAIADLASGKVEFKMLEFRLTRVSRFSEASLVLMDEINGQAFKYDMHTGAVENVLSREALQVMKSALASMSIPVQNNIFYLSKQLGLVSILTTAAGVQVIPLLDKSLAVIESTKAVKIAEKDVAVTDAIEIEWGGALCVGIEMVNRTSGQVTLAFVDPAAGKLVESQPAKQNFTNLFTVGNRLLGWDGASGKFWEITPQGISVKSLSVPMLEGGSPDNCVVLF